MPEVRVCIVLDAGFGARLSDLARKHYVWIVQSPDNDQAAREHWRAQELGDPDFRSDLRRGVTTFVPLPFGDELLDMIEEHHGNYAQEAAVDVLEIIGLALAPEHAAALAEYGYSDVAPTTNGFVARRAPSDQK